LDVFWLSDGGWRNKDDWDIRVDQQLSGLSHCRVEFT
jgi:hypothetical protein